MSRETEIPDDAVTCLRCRRVSVAVTKAAAEAHIERHNRRRESDPEAMRWWPKPATLDGYRCLGCGTWGPYRKAKAGDCPLGATINTVVCEHAE
jgi:hypothetical protein